MATDEDINCYNEIIAKGCCKRCALRYFGHDKTLMSYDYPTTSLVNMGLLPPEEEFEIEPPIKVKKHNPCLVCLGVLQDPIIEVMLSHEDLLKAQEYQHDTYVTYVTFPRCILLRDHSMKIHLKRHFPNFDVKNVVKINHAWRYAVNTRLSKILKKKPLASSKLTIHFYVGYALEDDEVAVVNNYITRTLEQPHLSRHSVTTFLETITDEHFSSLVQVPPTEPLYGVTFNELKCFSETVHLLGNFCKYSRQLKLPITSKGEESIENIVIETVAKMLPCRTVAFKASSFDEYNVRVIGKGRSFQLLVTDPRFDKIPDSKLKEIENKVNEVQTLEIKNLKETDRREITVVMDSEKLNPKSYKALCLVSDFKNIDYCVNAINMHHTFVVSQKTPLRLLHQRDYRHRKRKVFYIRATKVGENLIEVDLCTECGLYIHEFISGEMGRSTPSLSEIIKAKAEVLALDLVDLQSTVDCAVEEDEVII